MELRTMRSPSVFARFRAADLLLDSRDAIDLQHFVGNLCSQTAHLRQGSTRRGDHLHNEMAFTEFRQEFTAELRQSKQGGHADNGYSEHQGDRPARNKIQDAAIRAL